MVIENILVFKVVTGILNLVTLEHVFSGFCSVVSDWYQFYLAVSEALQFEPGEPVFSVEARALIAETLSSESVYRLLGDAIDEHCRGSHAEGRLDHSSPDFVQSVETCA